MALGIGAGGFMGIAPEVTAGTYVAPTKFVPIRSESMRYVQDTQFRRVMRALADVAPGAIPGNAHVEGDIEMEALTDIVPYFLHASRNTVAKSGAGPYTYTYTPSAAAFAPNKTLSITIVKGGEVFSFVGCVVGSFTFGVDGTIATFSASIIGQDEATAAVPTPTWTSTETPFGAGQYSIQIPTPTQVFDVDTFSFQVEDNAEPAFRLKSTRGAQFIKFGERDVTVSMERDFTTRAEHDEFKALTARSVTIRLDKGATNRIDLKAPAAIREGYDLGGLSSVGDLIRATVNWRATYDAATSKAYEIIVNTAENIV